MAEPTTVRRPGPRDELPHPGSLLAVAIACFGLGFLLARASLDRHPVADAQDGAPTSTETPPEPSVVPSPPRERPVDGGLRALLDASAADAGAGTDASRPVLDAAVPPIPDPIPAPEPLPMPAAEGSGPAEVVHGRVAYIRCDGVPQRPGPNPCPRDASVERAVWAAIDRMGACPALAGQRGGADVRVVFEQGAVTGLGFRPLDPPALDVDGVRSCLMPAVRDLRSSLGATRMTASFRFDLR